MIHLYCIYQTFWETQNSLCPPKSLEGRILIYLIYFLTEILSSPFSEFLYLFLHCNMDFRTNQTISSQPSKQDRWTSIQLLNKSPKTDLFLSASTKQKETGHMVLKSCNINNIQPKMFISEALPIEDNKLWETRTELLLWVPSYWYLLGKYVLFECKRLPTSFY